MFKSLKSRIFTSYGIIFILVLMILIGSSYEFYRSLLISEQVEPVVSQVSDLIRLHEHISSLERRLEEIDHHRSRIETERLLQEHKGVCDALCSLKASLTAAEEAPLLHLVLEADSNHQELAKNISNLISPAYSVKSADYRRQLSGDIKENLIMINNLYLDIHQQLIARTEYLLSGKIQTLRLSHYVFAALSIVVFLLSLFFGISLVRSIHRPLQSLRLATEALSQGEMDVSLDTDVPSELKDVVKAFNNMAAELKNNIREIEHKDGLREESEKKYRNLFQNMTSGFALHEIICDDKGTPVDYRFLAINPAFERLTGLKVDYLIGKTVLEVMPSTEKYWIENYGKVALIGETMQFENYAQELDKYYEVLAFSPELGKFAVIFNDVTVRKKAEIDIKVAKKLYSELVETAHDMIWKCNQEGRYIFLNKACEDIYGYPVDEMINRPFTDFMDKETADRDLATFQKILADQKEVTKYETTHLRKDGTPVHLSFNARYYTDEEENVIGTQGTAIDITSRKLAENKLKDYQDRLEELVEERTKELNTTQMQLIQSEKMASLGTLVAGIAHEINNPLNFIDTGLQAMRENFEFLNKKIKECASGDDIQESVAESLDDIESLLQNCETGVDRTSEIISSLKTFSAQDKGGMERININETLEFALTILYNFYKNIIEIERKFGDIPQVRGYPGMLSQVFVNIIKNAIDSISSKVRMEQEKIVISTTREGDSSIRVSIANTGPAVPAELRNKIFDPFFTTKKQGEGTGLGLSISSDIIKKHSGSLSLRESGGMVIFDIILNAFEK